MEAKKASTDLTSLQSLMAEKQHVLASIQGRLTNSQACLEEQRSSLESLEVQARLLRTDMPHLYARKSEVHHSCTCTMQVACTLGLVDAGPLKFEHSA